MSDPFIGEIRLLGFSRVPSGWLPCDGSLQPISDWDALFALIGTAYGGDGQTTFAMPDLRGRIPLHNGTGPGLTPRTIGGTSGSESVALTSVQMPNHSHSITATTATANATAPGPALSLGALSGDTMYLSDTNGATPVTMSSQSTSLPGGNLPHDNLMPTLTVQYCIAAVGLFPQQS